MQRVFFMVDDSPASYLATLLLGLSAAHLYRKAVQPLPDPLLRCSNLFLTVELVSR